MRKQLLSLTLGALLLPAFNVNAEEQAITEKWKTPQIEAFKGKWGGAALDWNSPEAIKPESNTRFATARDGKIYTVNQMTMAIAEVTETGLNDVYYLSQPANSQDFYGTAIALDEVGNFLVGMNFTAKPGSSLNWAVYSPTEDKVKTFTLPAPEGWNIGRVDCVGRVLGDLTKEAVFTIVPETGNYTSAVRVISVKGEGTVESIKMSDAVNVDVAGNFTQQNIAQPAYNTLAEAKAANGVNDFYYSSCDGTNNFYTLYSDGKTNNNFAPDLSMITFAGTNGFDTFSLNGKRYFVRNYSENAGDRTMDIVVTDENGDALATWSNPDYVLDGGYSSIIAEPLADNTANIYVFNSGNKFGAAAMLTFDPAKAGEPVKPAAPVGTQDNPYKIWTPEDLSAMKGKITSEEFFVTLEDDINMDGVAYSTIQSAATIYFDGKNHVIKNLTPSGDNSALFTDFKGYVKNLGLENVNSSVKGWGTSGTIIGYVAGGEALVENCYASGSASGFYAGGLVAGIQASAKATIRNCYSLVNVTSGNGYAGGVAGPCNTGATLVIENVYSAGSVSGVNTAAGIAAGVNNSYNGATVTINNAAVFCPSITCTANADAIIAPNAANMTVTMTGTYVCDGTTVNGTAVSEGVAKDELVATVQHWPGFNKNALNAATQMPILAWQTGLQAGVTEDFPLTISTAEDLVNMSKNMIDGAYTYIVFDNDIDMDGVVYTTPYVNSIAKAHIDGRNHVIKNFKVTAAFAGLFGQLDGTVKNLGFENVNSVAAEWGSAGAIAGYVGVNEPGSIENCFVTGYVQGYYSGGFAGGTKAGLTIKDCYSTTDVVAKENGIAGGLLGTICFIGNGTNTVSISNSYASGSIVGLSGGGGLVGSNQVYNHPASGSTEVLNLNNVAVFNPAINATVAGPFVAVDPTFPVVLNVENASVSNEVTINNEIVSDGVAQSALVKTVMAWEGFNSGEVSYETGFPILAWQEGQKVDTSAIEEIETAEDSSAVYYNLQGVQVANPENGIYIVRRGNKVTKELVK